MKDQYRITAGGSKLVAQSSQLLTQTLIRRGGSINQTTEINFYAQKLF
jgi:hypothetical protein